MRLTKIEKQKHTKDRYALYVNDQFWLGVHENIIVQYNLLKSQEVTQAFLEEIAQAEYRQKIYSRALRYLSKSLRSEQEVRQHLYKSIEEEGNAHACVDRSGDAIALVIDQTIDRLKEQNYLDDLFYAQSYVQTQINLQQKGQRAISQYLSEKGVSEPLILQALQAYTPDDQKAVALHLCQKLIRSRQSLPAKKLIEKIKISLYQKGFDQGLIHEVIGELMIEENQEKVNDALHKEADKALKKYAKKHDGYVLRQKITAYLLGKGYDFNPIQHWLEDHQERLKG